MPSFLVRAWLEEHPKASVNFSVFCEALRETKTLTVKRKGNLKMRKVSETHYEREMEAQIRSQEESKKDAQESQCSPEASFFCSERDLEQKRQSSCETWADPAADDGQPQEGKATEQKGKYQKESH